MTFIKTTEKASKYNDLEKMSINNLLININNEDKTVPYAVEKAIPQIEKLTQEIVEKLKIGGRLFYLGAWRAPFCFESIKGFCLLKKKRECLTALPPRFRRFNP